MEIDDHLTNMTEVKNKHIKSATYYLNKWILGHVMGLPRIILVVSSICTIGAFLNIYLKDFPIPLPLILFLFGCSLEILAFTSLKVQDYVSAIQWMSPKLFFDIFTPIIIFNVAFDIDIYMFQKLIWQILLITIPGFLLNNILIFWYLSSVNKLPTGTIPLLLFSLILHSSDPMLTAAAIRNLGLSRSLSNLINGESLMCSILSLMVFSFILDINITMQKNVNFSIGAHLWEGLYLYFGLSFVTGILSSKILQLWMSTIFGDDLNHISLSFSILYLIFYFSEMYHMSGIFTLAIVGLFLNSTSFKPGVEALLLEFWNCLSFSSFLIVFTFIGLLIPAQTYLYISFSDIYFSLNMYLTMIVLRFLVILLISPLLGRLGHGFNWRWAFIMVLSEMRGTPNINMALLLAYDFNIDSEREKSQMLFHGVAVCFITLISNKFFLPLAVSKLGLRDITSLKYKSLYYTYKHFQELTKSIASTLKFDKDLANADWNIVEKTIILHNPYAASQEETAARSVVKCPDCNKEIDETLNTEAMELANRRLLSTQIASYQRQYKNETLTQSAVQLLVGAAGSFGEKKGEYMSPETIKKYSEGKKSLTIMRKLLLDWVYNTRRERGIPSSHFLLHLIHEIVFSDEFEYIGYLIVLMNLFPIIISWISSLNNIYEVELKRTNLSFLGFYILEITLKIVAMKKDYFLHTWNTFELVITLIGIMDAILDTLQSEINNFNSIKIIFMIKIIRIFRVLRIMKNQLKTMFFKGNKIIKEEASHSEVSSKMALAMTSCIMSISTLGQVTGILFACTFDYYLNVLLQELVTPKLLQIIDRRMSLQLSFRYSILKGYVQGEADIMPIINQISSSKQVRQMLLKQVTRNSGRAMKELGYLEYDHPEIAITMKTKDQINVMLNIAREIVKDFRSKGIIQKTDGYAINRLITARKREMLDFQPKIRSLTLEEAVKNIPWLDKNRHHISFFLQRALVVTFDCGNDIFEEGEAPKGIYIVISGMVKLHRAKLGLANDCGSEEKDFQISHSDYVISGDIIGELDSLVNKPMKYSATCKTVVETCFISRKNLLESFEQCCPLIEYKMWLKIGLSISAKKLRENLSYEDWNYKMQLQLCGTYVKDIPMNTKTDIYDETVIYVILINGVVEDCQLRKIYKAPSLIPLTCHQIQGTENFTKIMILQTSFDKKKSRGSSGITVPLCSHSLERS